MEEAPGGSSSIIVLGLGSLRTRRDLFTSPVFIHSVFNSIHYLTRCIDSGDGKQSLKYRQGTFNINFKANKNKYISAWKCKCGF